MSRFGCSKCGKQSNSQDLCCGNTMARKGDFGCPECGKSASKSQRCCGEDMVQV